MTQHAGSDMIQLKDGILEVTLTTAQSAETVKKLSEDIVELSNGKRYDILVNAASFTRGDGTGMPMAVKLFKTIPYNRFAVYGANPKFANQRIKAMTDMVGEPERVKFFRKEDDAREWLASEV